MTKAAPAFRYEMGRACLDFVATRTPPAARRDGEPDRADLLETVENLHAWLVGSRLPAQRLEPDTADLGRALCLRHAMAIVLEHVLDHPVPSEETVDPDAVPGLDDGDGFEPGDLDPGGASAATGESGSAPRVLDERSRLRRAAATVNGLAAVAPPVVRLRPGKGDALVVQPTYPVETEPVLALIAQDLLTLLADPDDRARLRRCAAEDCRRVFITERVGRPRRWCSSSGCGARTRVAAYRARLARRAPSG